MLKIAITGKMGSGKSSLATLLAEMEDAYVTSFSSKIKKVISDLGLSPHRTLLQETGDFFRKFDNLVWVKALLNEVRDLDRLVVVDGIRYAFERDALVAEGFKIIKLSCADDIRRKRIEKRDGITIDDRLWESWQQHPTETEVDEIIVDYRIINDNSLDSLKKTVSKILINMRGK